MNKYFTIYIPANGYKFNDKNVKFIYKKYINTLSKMKKENSSLFANYKQRKITWILRNLFKMRFLIITFKN